MNSKSSVHFCVTALAESPSLEPWFEHWRSSLTGERSPLHDELPWMTYAAIDWLQTNLRRDMTLFEWGSGGSTAFFASRVKRVITVEHDCSWYEQVVDTLHGRGFKNTSVTLAEPTVAASSSPSYSSTDDKYQGYTFENYVRSIDQYPDLYFDIVIIDGRSRADCIRHSIPKIKVGGYLLLDNSERAEYESGTKLVQGWKSIHMWGPGPYNGYPWETRIWRKP
jgi:hypothetical protein